MSNNKVPFHIIGKKHKTKLFNDDKELFHTCDFIMPLYHMWQFIFVNYYINTKDSHGDEAFTIAFRVLKCSLYTWPILTTIISISSRCNNAMVNIP